LLASYKKNLFSPLVNVRYVFKADIGRYI